METEMEKVGSNVINEVGIKAYHNDFRLKNIEVSMEKIELDISKMVSMMNGKDGIITTLELHDQTIKNIPTPSSLKLYAFVGGGVTSIMAVISWAIYGIFKSSAS